MPELTFHEGLTNEAYHALKAVSPSQIKTLARSPLHYFDQFLADDREKKEATAAMQMGTALHTAVLEPDLWDATVAVPPHKFDRRTKVGKELAAEFEWVAAGKIVLDPDDAAQVQQMAQMVRSHPAAGFLLDMPGRREPSYTWTDSTTGLECKVRPDWHSEDRRIVVDVKTTKDASRNEFSKSIANFDYHVQAAWNLDALEAEKFLIIAVENVRPFAVAVYPLSPSLIAAGQRRISAAMELLAECHQTGRWPGYGDLVQDDLDLPGWVRD